MDIDVLPPGLPLGGSLQLGRRLAIGPLEQEFAIAGGPSPTMRCRTAVGAGPAPMLLGLYSSWLYVPPGIWPRMHRTLRLPDGRPGLIYEASAPQGWLACTSGLTAVDWIRVGIELAEGLSRLHREGIVFGTLDGDLIHTLPGAARFEVRVSALSRPDAARVGALLTRPGDADRDERALGRLLIDGAASLSGGVDRAVGRRLREVARRASADDPGSRFEDLAELRAALVELLESMPADPPARAEQSTQPSHRTDTALGDAEAPHATLTSSMSGDFDIDDNDVTAVNPATTGPEALHTADPDCTREVPLHLTPEPLPLAACDEAPTRPGIERPAGIGVANAREIRPGLVVEGLRVPMMKRVEGIDDEWMVPSVVPGGRLRHRVVLRPFGDHEAVIGARIESLGGGPLPSGIASRLSACGEPLPRRLDEVLAVNCELSFSLDWSAETPLQLRLVLERSHDPLTLELSIPPPGRSSDGLLIVDMGCEAPLFATLVNGTLRLLGDGDVRQPPDAPDETDAELCAARCAGRRLARALGSLLDAYRLAPREMLILPGLDVDEFMIQQLSLVAAQAVPGALIHLGLPSTLAAGLEYPLKRPRLLVDIGARATRCIALEHHGIRAIGRAAVGGVALGEGLLQVRVESTLVANDRRRLADATSPQVRFRMPGTGRASGWTPSRTPRVMPTLPWLATTSPDAAGSPRSVAPHVVLFEADDARDPRDRKIRRRLELAVRTGDSPEAISSLCAELSWSRDGLPAATLSSTELDAIARALSTQGHHCGPRLDAACRAILDAAWSVVHAAWGESPPDFEVVLAGRGARGVPIDAWLGRSISGGIRRAGADAVFRGALRWRSRGYPPMWPSPDRLGITVWELGAERRVLLDADCRVRRAVTYIPPIERPATVAVSRGDLDPQICGVLEPPPPDLRADGIKLWVESNRTTGRRQLMCAYVSLGGTPADCVGDDVEEMRQRQPPLPTRDEGDGALQSWWASPPPSLPGEQTSTPRIVCDLSGGDIDLSSPSYVEVAPGTEGSAANRSLVRVSFADEHSVGP